MHWVAIFLFLCVPQCTVLLRSGLAATEEWCQEDDGRPGLPEEEQVTEQEAAREGAHDLEHGVASRCLDRQPQLWIPSA